MAEGRQMGGRAEQNDGRRRRRAFPRWHLFAILSSTTALGLCLSLRVWGQPGPLGTPAAAVLKDFLGHVFGHAEWNSEEIDLKPVYLFMDRNEKDAEGQSIWPTAMGHNFAEEVKDNWGELLLQSPTFNYFGTFGYNRQFRVQLMEISDGKGYIEGNAVEYMAYRRRVGERASVVVATDSDETLSSVMQQSVELLGSNFQFSSIPLTKKGTGFCKEIQCHGTLLDILMLEKHKLAIKDVASWTKYVDDGYVKGYTPFALAIDYKDGGSVVDEKMKPITNTREELGEEWVYELEDSDKRNWFPVLVGAQLKVTQDILFEESEGDIGRKEGGLSANYDLKESSYVTERKFSVNGVETRIWLANASPEHNEDGSWVDSFQDINGWMEPSANCEGTETNKSAQWVMTFSAVEELVIQVRHHLRRIRLDIYRLAIVWVVC
eukprot:GHVS01034485.1.p1 GENE.GHVS01034485.1~~GHVS01034485.1.p1  ORF type:complete len:435 (+),score=37.22 GHVS01034485.1:176-1480(+)